MIAIRLSVPLTASLFLSLGALPAAAQSADMTFFVTSVGSGKGGDLGGLSGADAHCQQLAAAVGAGGKTWRAYLSTQGDNAVNARDRIGNGPWRNAKGIVVATSVADLHSENNKLNKQNSLSEKGEIINGTGDKPNRHDALTGTQADGTAFPADKDMTCRSWTSSTQGIAMVGHIDRAPFGNNPNAPSWNTSHPSREPRDGSAPGQGCSQTALRGSGGDGLFYCFAVN
jgi:hypothetical protein